MRVQTDACSDVNYRVSTGQGKVREIQGQGILEIVREICNFGESRKFKKSQGNLRKYIFEKRLR